MTCGLFLCEESDSASEPEERYDVVSIFFKILVPRKEQPIMRIEDRLFGRGWARSAMATRKCGNIYFRKYFMAIRKLTNIFVLLLILMVGSRDTLFLICFT